jgi:hypothetical protein
MGAHPHAELFRAQRAGAASVEHVMIAVGDGAEITAYRIDHIVIISPTHQP